jgi:hypothetical protein
VNASGIDKGWCRKAAAAFGNLSWRKKRGLLCKSFNTIARENFTGFEEAHKQRTLVSKEQTALPLSPFEKSEQHTQKHRHLADPKDEHPFDKLSSLFRHL